MPTSRLPIVSLLKACRPTTVVGAVILIVVAAIQCCLWRRIAHVGVKVFETQPTFTNFNAAPAITFVGVKIRIETPRLHRFPTAINASIRLFSFPISALSVFKSGFQFSTQTAARFGRAVQIVSEKGTLFSAFTFAKIASVWFSVDEREDGQASKFLTREINGFRHKLDYKLRRA